MSEDDEKVFNAFWDRLCELEPEQQAILLQKIDDMLREKDGKLLEDDLREGLDRKVADWVREHFI